MRGAIVRSLPVIWGMLTPGAVAWASVVGEHGEDGLGPWFNLGCAFVNFALFVYLMRRFTRIPLRDYLHRRRRLVVEEMAAAANARSEAEALKREADAKLAQLDAIRSKLVAEIETIARSERDRAVAAAEETGRRLEADAERRAHHETERARRELRAEAARLAARLAEAQLTERLGEEEQRRLVQEFLQGVAQS